MVSARVVYQCVSREQGRLRVSGLGKFGAQGWKGLVPVTFSPLAVGPNSRQARMDSSRESPMAVVPPIMKVDKREDRRN